MFWESVKKLDETLEKRDDGSPAKLSAIPFYYLIAHAVELFLKSALLKRGFEEKKLRHKDYRHNLNVLLKALQEKEITISPQTVELVNSLNLRYSNHTFRYDLIIGGGKKYWPPTSLMHPMLEELLLLTKISTQGK